MMWSGNEVWPCEREPNPALTVLSGLNAEAVGQGKGEGRGKGKEESLRGAQTKTASPRSRKKEGTELVGL
jgi:hypothetical protein